MTVARRAASAECLHCGVEFEPRKAGHIFCSTFCRHRGERQPDQRVDDRAAVERLFDPSRDPGERVRVDDWFPRPGSEAAELFECDTVGDRRRWYQNLLMRR